MKIERLPFLLMLGLVGCSTGKDNREFAAMQERGEHVMGVDQYTSAHVFEDLSDGGRVLLDRDDPADTAGIKAIRAHMRDIATAFRAGDFTKPFAVHAQTVPGTSIMTASRCAVMIDVPGTVCACTANGFVKSPARNAVAMSRMCARMALMPAVSAGSSRSRSTRPPSDRSSKTCADVY